MNTSQCDNLDLYLAGELPPQARVDFEAHCRQCDDCAGELERESQLDRMISAAAAQPDPYPPQLTERVRVYVELRNRRRSIYRCVLAAAAVIVVGVILWSLAVGPVNDREPSQQAASAANATREQATEFEHIRIDVLLDHVPHMMVAPVGTGDYNMTVLWLTLRTSAVVQSISRRGVS